MRSTPPERSDPTTPPNGPCPVRVAPCQLSDRNQCDDWHSCRGSVCRNAFHRAMATSFGGSEDRSPTAGGERGPERGRRGTALSARTMDPVPDPVAIVLLSGGLD